MEGRLYGYAGRVLWVDLTRESVKVKPLEEELARRYIGGKGLGARVLHEAAPPKVDSFDPMNPLILATGPVNGLTLSGAAKFCAVFKSPLTDGWGESQCGGFFAPHLKRAGYDFTITPDESCCGMHPYWDGEVKLTADIAKSNIEIFRKTGAKRIVTACAGCYSSFKNAYPELVDNFDFELVHFSELLLDLIKEGKIKLRETGPLKVTYHDPCHLGRHSGVYDAPRAVIESIPGVELVEMEHSREDSNCCGGGGGYFTAFPENAVRIAEKRVREAEETGADVLVTTCPLCRTNLDLAIKRLDSGLRLYDLADLVLEHLE